MVKKDIYFNKLKQLLEGQDRKEVSEWAVEEEKRNDNQNIILNPLEQEILDCLQICTALDEHGKFLYKKIDFEAWYNQYENT